MATINNMVTGGFNSNTGAAIKKQISDTSKELRDLQSNGTLTDKERKEQQDILKEKLSSLSDELSSANSAKLSSIQAGGTGAFGGIAGAFGGGDANAAIFGASNNFDVLLGGAAQLTNLKSVNSARLGIESRARNLTAEIKMDQMRGINTDGKKKALSNLTGNLSLLNKNLAKDIDSTLGEEKTAAETTSKSKLIAHDPKAPAIIDRINTQLSENQKALDGKDLLAKPEAKTET